MLRIRYVDHYTRKDHKISVKKYQSASTGAYYRVILNESNPEELQYYIRNERSKELVYKSGNYTNGNALRKAARKELARFGVPIGKENRERSFGLCPKGYTQEQWEAQEMYKLELLKQEEND